MTIDMFGYNNAVAQSNDRSLETQNFNEGVADWNNKIQNQYNTDKKGEGLTDDATYVKDLVGNMLGATGLRQAHTNLTNTAIDTAKQTKANLMKQLGKDVETKPPELPAVSDISGGDAWKTMPDIVKESYAKANIEPPNLAAGEPNGLHTSLGGGVENSALDQMNDVIKSDKRPESTLLGKAVGKLSGGAMGEAEARTLGKFGGAITNATLGGIDAVDDVGELINSHGKHFFNPDNSTADDWDNSLQMVAGASDIVGLIPGLEWVAALGNVAGITGSVIGMFGDHDKNIQSNKAIADKLNQLKSGQSSSANTGQIAQVSQSTLQHQAAPISAY